MTKFELIGKDELVKKLQELTPNIQQNLQASIFGLVIKLQSYIQSNKLSGQVLKTKTGTLRRSIATKVASDSNSIVGVVGTNSNYGLMHEYGFKGNETVQAHLRRITMAWGKSISPRTINVRTHSRAVDFPERSFLRSALEDMKPDIIIGIDQAIQGALSES